MQEPIADIKIIAQKDDKRKPKNDTIAKNPLTINTCWKQYIALQIAPLIQQRKQIINTVNNNPIRKHFRKPFILFTPFI